MNGRVGKKIIQSRQRVNKDWIYRGSGWVRNKTLWERAGAGLKKTVPRRPLPCPLRLRAHSTRGVASSWTLARGASLADICRAAGWATPNTFARFYLGSILARLAASLTHKFSREFPTGLTLSSPRASGARPFSQWILEIWCEASAHMSDPVGIPYVYFHGTLTRAVFSLADRILPSLNDAAWVISETSMCNRALRGYFTWVNVT